MKSLWMLCFFPIFGYGQDFMPRLSEINHLSAAVEDAIKANNADHFDIAGMIKQMNINATPKNRSYTRSGNTKRQLDTWELETYQIGTSGWIDLIRYPEQESPGRITNLDGWFSNVGRAYIQVKTDSFSTLGTFILLDHQLINLGFDLDFPIPGLFDDLTLEQQASVRATCDALKSIIRTMLDVNLPPPLTAAQRLEGMIQFWSEVKYNFAFFDQVPELDWEQTLRDYIPLMLEDQSNLDYYHQMERLCALLHDGHTNIYPPAYLTVDEKSLPVEFNSIEGHIYITNTKTSLNQGIRAGLEVIRINGMDVVDYLNEYIYPFISASTSYIREDWSATALQKGKAGNNLEITVRDPEGTNHSFDLIYGELDDQLWSISYDHPNQFEFKQFDDRIAYVNLGSFGQDWIVEAFNAKFDSIKRYDALIIDLRYNGGGNSDIGYAILDKLTDQPYTTSTWRTREHLAAFKAWGKYLYQDFQRKQGDTSGMDDWSKKSIRTYLGDEWYVAKPDTIVPSSGPKFLRPVVVLTGHATASAAEDFLVAADRLGHFTIVGQHTFGSTGQPLKLALPYGGSARICTKRDTYPDGREFVGYGITPDVYVPMTIESVIHQQDLVLQKALEIIHEKLR
ncbi:MAG: hypothetical protein KDC57_18235 [Saprospiraceae bacterium]|nr:hypothetical protein [Saprospiraceae bacterium]